MLDQYSPEISKIEKRLDSLENDLEVLKGIESKLVDAKKKHDGIAYNPITKRLEEAEYSFFEKVVESVVGKRFYWWRVEKYSKEGQEEEGRFRKKLSGVYNQILRTGVKIKNTSSPKQGLEECEKRFNIINLEYRGLENIHESRRTPPLFDTDPVFHVDFPTIRPMYLELDYLNDEKIEQFEKSLEVAF